MPYTVTLIEGEKFRVYETLDGDYRIRFLPPWRDPAMLTGRQPEGLTMNGRPAFEANVMRIDFHKNDFNRGVADSLDPPEEVIQRAVAEFHTRLRFTTRAAHAQPLSFPWNQWRLEYTNDDGSPLEAREGYVKGRGTLQVQFSFIGLSREVWDNIFALPDRFEVPVWDALRLDAQAALPDVGTAVVLAATSLEVFISVLLDALASRQDISPHLWKWIRERDGKRLQQPSVEEQFSDLLKDFSGHSLKEEPVLWEKFKNLRTARNTFVHQGVAKVGNAAITKDDAASLVGHVNSIIDKVRTWIPDDLRWPVPQANVEIAWTQRFVEPTNPVDAAVASPHPAN